MKSCLDDLAIWGKQPAFQSNLHVGRPNIGNQNHFLERINDMLSRRWLSNDGPYAVEFEQLIAQIIGVKHCIVMCNATIALEIAIRAAGLSGEVIVPSFTFVATAHALQWQEITPVFCDVDPQTHTLDPQKVEQMITPRTSGIIGVHLWGQSCYIDELADIAKRHKLKLLFDAAHAFGCSYKGQMLGNFGDAEVFSFHATKFVNALEGGAVVTNNDELAAKVRLMKNFGFTGYDQVDYIGTNGKMNEASAAMGLTSLESMDEFVTINRRNYHQYGEELVGLPGIHLYQHDESEKRNYQYIILEVDEAEAGLSRDELMQVLRAENVLARRYFYPGCHRMEPYRSYFPHAGLLLLETEKLTNSVLCLPTGTAAESNDIALICSVIRTAVTHGKEVHQRLMQSSQQLISEKDPASERELARAQ